MKPFKTHFYIKTLLFLAGITVIFSSCSKSEEVDATTSTSTTTTSGSASTYSQSSGTVTESGKTYTSSTADLSAVKVTGGTYTISKSTISSTGNTSSSDNSSFYGLNAVVLAYASSETAAIVSTGNTISSSGSGANGIFAYGSGTITSTGDKITCTGNGGHAIMCSGGGTVTVTNDTSSTAGSSSSNIATDRGSGTINVTGGVYTSSGDKSAAIYSTGTITCNNATLTATGAEAVVVEGANKAILNNCTTKSTYNKWGALIYQSMSGDASGTVGSLTISGGSFTYSGTSGGMFYNTNDSAYIYLTGVTLTNSCDTLVRCIKGSWGGSSATNGGCTHLICSGQTIKGLIHADANSKVYLSLKSSSSFTGRINSGNTAKLASVTMDAPSSWTLTGNTYLSALVDSDTSYSNITANGYKLYVNNTQIK
ncbi:MAG: hypothetical protein Q8861_08585 [Bacteroidota bacterium]|nr:hypothetical protein [Bacteroidota bacterium]